MKARKPVRRRRQFAGCAGFNGAAPMKARKLGRGGTRKARRKGLQWGRADEGAETMRACAKVEPTW